MRARISVRLPRLRVTWGQPVYGGESKVVYDFHRALTDYCRVGTITRTATRFPTCLQSIWILELLQNERLECFADPAKP
jgi:hypothetical protein